MPEGWSPGPRGHVRRAVRPRRGWACRTLDHGCDFVGRVCPREAFQGSGHALLREEETQEHMTAAEAQEAGEEYDEHVWTSPRNVILLTEALRDDPVKAVVHGFTHLGLMELTRKKTDIQTI